MNDLQRHAAELDHPRIVCVASAGSGKTTVLVERIARLIASGTPADRILAFTFTRKAAHELLERLQAKQGVGEDLPEVGTVHAWATRVLREHPEAAGRTTGFKIYDEDTCTALMKDLRAKTPGDPLYRDALRSADALDFQGLEDGAVEALRANAALWHAKYDHVLLDEAQDSSGFEAMLLGLLNPPNLFVVGDLRQAIFAFRGATGELMRNAVQDPGWRLVELVQNYRSAAAIVDFANRVTDGAWAPATSARSDHHPGRVSIQSSDASELVRVVKDLRARYGREGVVVLGRTWREVEAAARTVDVKLNCPPDDRNMRDVARFAQLCLNPWDDNLGALVFQRPLDSVDLRAKATINRSFVVEQASVLCPDVERREMAHEALAATPERSAAAVIERFFNVPALIESLRRDRVTLKDFVEDISERHRSADKRAAFTTIHSYKGLESPAVVVLGCTTRNFPEKSQEAANLFYVAVTRARDELVLLYDRDEVGRSRPSPFLGELPDDAGTVHGSWGADPW